MTETPAEADNITLSDPMIVSPLLLENTVFLLGSDKENLPAVTCKPVLSRRINEIIYKLASKYFLSSPSIRSVWMFLLLLLMLTEKFPSDRSLMGCPGTDDMLDITINNWVKH